LRANSIPHPAGRRWLAPYLDKLSDRDLAAPLPAIVAAIKESAPSDEMFGDGIRNSGLELLARLHIREGMPLYVSIMDVDRWDGGRTGDCLKTLCKYDRQAKEVLPQLKELRKQLATGSDLAKKIDATIAYIETTKDSPTIVDLKDFIAKASANVDTSNNTKKGTP